MESAVFFWSDNLLKIQFVTEIFKFREDKSNNVFREILKCFRKTAKFEFFAKQIIYLESPDHPLQNDIWYVRVLRVWNFFELPKMA